MSAVPLDWRAFVKKLQAGEFTSVAGPTAPEWSDQMPNRVGLWQVKCMESNNEPDFVAITTRKGGKIVHSADLCETPLEAFHYGLTNIYWKHIA